MIIKKITTGYVIQSFDTEKHEFVSQKFVATSETSYKNESGETVKDPIASGMEESDGSESYLPFDMVQPIVELTCAVCGEKYNGPSDTTVCLDCC